MKLNKITSFNSLLIVVDPTGSLGVEILNHIVNLDITIILTTVSSTSSQSKISLPDKSEDING
jgi:hypothetical protein